MIKRVHSEFLSADFWRLPVSADGRSWRSVAQTLSASERSRADTLAAAERDKYFAVHGYVHRILALYLKASRKACVCYDQLGKLQVCGSPRIWISISRAGNAATVAVSKAGPIGVDIEERRSMRRLDGAEALIMDEGGRQSMLLLPTPLKRLARLACWVRKEAYLKAVGVGLRAHPQAVRVAVDPRRRCGIANSWMFGVYRYADIALGHDLFVSACSKC